MKDKPQWSSEWLRISGSVWARERLYLGRTIVWMVTRYPVHVLIGGYWNGLQVQWDTPTGPPDGTFFLPWAEKQIERLEAEEAQ